jgi:hypothetical protein
MDHTRAPWEELPLEQPAGDPTRFEDLATDQRWNDRVAFGVSFHDHRARTTTAIEWLRLADRRYRLDTSDDGLSVAALSEAELQALLTSAACALGLQT